MSQDALREELRAILPEGHPFNEKFARSLTVVEEEEEYDPGKSHMLEMFSSAVETIDDWKRGIRDWSEVERYLVDIRAELQVYFDTLERKAA